jgi:hypothetical protein
VQPAQAHVHAPSPSPEPNWIKEALAKLREELTLFLRTVASFALRPRAAAAAWRAGSLQLLNPLGFLATSASITVPILHVLDRWAGEKDVASLGGELAETLAPFVHYIVLGVLAHVVLRLAGSREPLRNSVAVALYAGGGPGAAVNLVVAIAAGLLMKSRGTGNFFDATLPTSVRVMGFASVVAVFVAVFGSFAAGLAGLHRVRVWRSVLALLLAYLAAGLVFGAFKAYSVTVPEGIGLHLHLWLNAWSHQRGFQFGISN